MNRKKILFLLAIFVFFPLFSGEAGEIPVFVSIAPQKYFVQQIGKKHVSVSVMVAPGASPATYEPKPRQMAMLTKTKIYFGIGVPFETVWLEKISAMNPNMKVARTEKNIKRMPMESHDHGHGHGEEEAHEGHGHEGIPDPHIWLAPPLVKEQARVVYETLVAEDPDHKEDYRSHYSSFLKEIDDLDRELKELFKDKKGLSFMVFHPSWGYFAQSYGLNQIPVEVEGKEPKPGELKTLIKKGRAAGVKVIFAQPQFSAKSAKLIAREIGAKVLFADPLAEDWGDNMRKQAEKIRSALR